jgi:hypothetical protein
MVNLVLKGKKNWDDIEARRTGQPSGQPMTLTMMELQKASNRSQEIDIYTKLLHSLCCQHNSFPRKFPHSRKSCVQERDRVGPELHTVRKRR